VRSRRGLATKSIFAFNDVSQQIIGQFGCSPMAPPLLDNGENEDGAQGENEAGGQAVHRGSVEEFFSRWQDLGGEKFWVDGYENVLLSSCS
jgi:hypothetical protein